MTYLDYEALRIEFPALRLPLLNELSDTLFIEITKLFGKLTKDEFYARCLAGLLSNEPDQIRPRELFGRVEKLPLLENLKQR